MPSRLQILEAIINTIARALQRLVIKTYTPTAKVLALSRKVRHLRFSKRMEALFYQQQMDSWCKTTWQATIWNTASTSVVELKVLDSKFKDKMALW